MLQVLCSARLKSGVNDSVRGGKRPDRLTCPNFIFVCRVEDLPRTECEKIFKANDSGSFTKRKRCNKHSLREFEKLFFVHKRFTDF